MRPFLTGAAALLLLAGLAACDSGASAVKAPKASERASAIDTGTPTVASGSSFEGESSRRSDPRDAPVKLVSGKPYWAANRTRTAEENAQRAFERNGEVFKAKTTDDFVAKVHAALPETRIVYIAVKPSPSRWKLHEKFERTNALIAAACAKDPQRLRFVDVWHPMLDAKGEPRPELFMADMLHMKPAGYAIWTPLVAAQLK